MMMMMLIHNIFLVAIIINFAIDSIVSLQVNGGEWVQIGGDIEGKVAEDNFGRSVTISADGTVVGIGAPSAASPNPLGYASLYTINNTSSNSSNMGLRWQQLSTDITAEQLDDATGTAVAISDDGKTIICGSPESGNFRGLARVFAFDPISNTIVRVGSLVISEGRTDIFGMSVAISANGTIIAVGAPWNDSLNRQDSGHVRVYRYNANLKRWITLGSDIDGDDANDNFGWSVSMSADGKTIVIGAPLFRAFPSPNGKVSGYVRVYTFHSTTGTWVQVGNDIIGEEPYDEFGRSVDISSDGTTIVVGAPSIPKFIESPPFGTVRVYSYHSTSNTWIQVGNTVKGTSEGNTFGWSVAMSADGTMIAMGAYRYDNGLVQAYKYDTISSAWIQVGNDIVGVTIDTWFGYSIDMSANGETIVIGAPYFVNDVGDRTGHARVYKYNEPSQNCTISWTLYNSRTDSMVASLVNNTTIQSPPPCGYTNIEAVVPCADRNSVVVIELYNNTGSRIYRRNEREAKYFLFGNNGNNVYRGTIAAGTYKIRAIVDNDIPSPFTTFALRSNCTK